MEESAVESLKPSCDFVTKVEPVKTEPMKIGNYQLTRTIGKGTFAKVKEGIHCLTKEKVAVKVIDKTSIEDGQDQERIKREVQIMRILRHPNIIYLYEVIETDRFIYLVMEFAEKGELFKIMNNEVRLKQKAAGKIFLQILNAVEYLHRLNIAHRDLKPQNILLDEDYNVKLVDFGLSNYCPKGTLLATACGSPCYAPPEMVSGKKYDGIIGDIWSLGIVFYGMVCGSLPFEEKTTNELYRKVIEGFYVLPSDTSVEAIEVVQRLLVTDPKKRISLPELRKMKFFKQLRTMQPEIIGIIIGFHAMPIDNEILIKMKQYESFNKKKAEDAIRENQHNSITALYYLTQKKSLKEGNRTIVDLQTYLETSEKYQKQYGKQSLKKYKQNVLDTKRQFQTSLSRSKPKQRQFFSNDKLKRKIGDFSNDRQNNRKKSESARKRNHVGIKTERGEEEVKLSIGMSRKYKERNTPSKISPSRMSPSKPSLTPNRKLRKDNQDLWDTYFKNPIGTNAKQKPKAEKDRQTLPFNIKKLKQGLLKLPLMAKRGRISQETEK